MLKGDIITLLPQATFHWMQVALSLPLERGSGAAIEGSPLSAAAVLATLLTDSKFESVPAFGIRGDAGVKALEG